MNITANPELQEALSRIRVSPAVRRLIDGIADKPEPAVRLARLALSLRAKKHGGEAHHLATLALRLDPHNYRVRALTEWLLRNEAPLWHFNIIHDTQRNEVYQRAIEHWVRPGMTVFEIGTGTGLLAMLAARAGADHVYTCERRSPVAEAARDVISANGLSEKITVIAKSAYEVQPGLDIPRLADVFVAEIVDDILLGEQVLPLTRLARQKFLKPDAILLPRVIGAQGYLVSARGHHGLFRMGTTLGFDLRQFNRFSPLQIGSGAAGGEVDVLSEDCELLSLDLRQELAREGSRRVVLQVDRRGCAEGVMRWLKLDFGAGIVLENRPPQPSSWHPQIHLFQPREVEAGQTVHLEVAYDQELVFVNMLP